MRAYHAVSLLLVVGCIGTTEPADVVPDLHFELGPVDEIAQRASIEIGAQGQDVIVAGRMATHNTCYEIVASLAMPDSTQYSLAIEARSTRTVCWDISMSVPYVARFTSRGTGRYQVEVQHLVDGRPFLRVAELVALR